MTLQQDSSHPTGVSDDTPRGNSDVARARERKANAAIALKDRGYTWEQIAESLGYPTARQALVATELALESHLKTEESRAFMRQTAGRRYERLLRGVWPKAIDPQNPDHLQAVDRVRQIMKDHADLYGYVAPKQAVVTNPTAAQIESFVAQLLHLDQPTVEEDDIFEADVVGEFEVPDASQD